MMQIDSHLSNYCSTRYWKICGVNIVYYPPANGKKIGEWRSTLNEWLHKFQDVGLIDGLDKIVIGKNKVNRTATGIWYKDGRIRLENDPTVKRDKMVSNTVKGVLIHELAHHAHLYENDQSYENIKTEYRKKKVIEDVSKYASENMRESVAEIITGIVLGIDYPDWVHEYYVLCGGPMEVYDIG